MASQNLEIERKFLVRSLPANLKKNPKASIDQGYLVIEPGHGQVRVRRIADENFSTPEHYLTFKRREGTVRDEVNLAISREDFERLWPLTEGRRVEKTRYRIPWRKWTIELDIFHGKRDGLVLAEVEFADEKQCDAFTPPAWLGKDVTTDPAYKNTRLAS